jgi:hypothetical protein
MEETFMRFCAMLVLAALFMACFILAVFAKPRSPIGGAASTGSLSENQSVSGQIATVGDAAFAINITKGKQGPQTVEFLVDDQTKVEGKLTIGAQALVEYRSDSGRNIAVHVVVTPASGIARY